jgi:hypothetical protein
LTAPVQVEGKWYYFWDRDLIDNHTPTYSPPTDRISFTGLQTMMQAAGLEGPISESNRTFKVNGVTLKLVTDGRDGQTLISDTQVWVNGTSNSGQGIVENTTYDDMLALWDAFNGTGTGANTNGPVPGWGNGHYWTATPSAAGDGYAAVGTNSGATYGTTALTEGRLVAFELVSHPII